MCLLTNPSRKLRPGNGLYFGVSRLQGQFPSRHNSNDGSLPGRSRVEGVDPISSVTAAGPLARRTSSGLEKSTGDLPRRVPCGQESLQTDLQPARLEARVGGAIGAYQNHRLIRKAGRMIEVKLMVVGGDTESQELCLPLPATVGRSRDATLSLSHPLVSRFHCELYEYDGMLMVRDLESLNGTFVGSDRVDEAVVKPGDLLTIGTVTYRAIYEVSGDAEALKSAIDGHLAETAKSRGAETGRQRPRPGSSEDTQASDLATRNSPDEMDSGAGLIEDDEDSDTAIDTSDLVRQLRAEEARRQT